MEVFSCINFPFAKMLVAKYLGIYLTLVCNQMKVRGHGRRGWRGFHMVFKGERRVGGISCHQQGINGGPIEKFTVKLSANEGGNHKNKNEQSLMGDQVNVFLIQPKSPPPLPPPPTRL